MVRRGTAEAGEAIAAHWGDVEAEHAARRELAGHLVNRLHGRKTEMPEVTVRELPARTLLTSIRHVRPAELVPVGRELFISRLRRGGVPRDGDPFLIYHGEVSEDSDGPVEWCWPVPPDDARDIAAEFPDLTLRVEPAHEEAFLPCVGEGGAAAEAAIEAFRAWASEHGRHPAGAIRLVLMPRSRAASFAVPLSSRTSGGA
ncbi:hypothetical protein [Amycolatopsis sacchari]|uniref:hypothetical protein n=1 Tax=Amycolatopsis sacchari TaxID=115433 RepID=UPI003D709912